MGSNILNDIGAGFAGFANTYFPLRQRMQEWEMLRQQRGLDNEVKRMQVEQMKRDQGMKFAVLRALGFDPDNPAAFSQAFGSQGVFPTQTQAPPTETITPTAAAPWKMPPLNSAEIPPQYGEHVRGTADFYSIPLDPFARLFATESGWQPTDRAGNITTSDKGAQGIAQFIPGTAARYNVNVNDTGSSIRGAGRYLADIKKKVAARFPHLDETQQWRLAFAGYHQGEGYLDNPGATGKVPAASRDYVAKTVGFPQGYEPAAPAVPASATMGEQPGVPPEYTQQNPMMPGTQTPTMTTPQMLSWGDMGQQQKIALSLVMPEMAKALQAGAELTPRQAKELEYEFFRKQEEFRRRMKDPEGSDVRMPDGSFRFVKKGEQIPTGAMPFNPNTADPGAAAEGKMWAERLGVIFDDASSAEGRLQAIATAKSLMDQNPTMFMGAGAETKTAIVKWATSLGADVPAWMLQSAQSAEQLNALVMDNLMKTLMAQKGIQTEGDADRALRAWAELGKTPKANRFILAYSEALERRKIEQYQFVMRQKESGKSTAQALEAWNSRKGNIPLVLTDKNGNALTYYQAMERAEFNGVPRQQAERDWAALAKVAGRR